MHRLGTLTLTAAAFLSLAVSASAQTLKEQLVGTWTLVSNTEEYTDGKKVTDSFGPDLKGILMLAPTGQFSFALIGGERPKAGGDPRKPVGPAVAYFGTYSVGEGDKSLTYHIERATFPNFEGVDRKSTINVTGDGMTLAAGPIQSPNGTFTPRQEWKRAK